MSSWLLREAGCVMQDVPQASSGAAPDILSELSSEELEALIAAKIAQQEAAKAEAAQVNSRDASWLRCNLISTCWRSLSHKFRIACFRASWTRWPFHVAHDVHDVVPSI